MLHRAEFIYFMTSRHNYDSAGMLSRRFSYAFAASCQSVKFKSVNSNITLFKILGNITICRFILYRSYRSRFEYIFRPENFFNIFLSFSLIFTCKIKVNVGLLVCFKSQEGFKWYRESFLVIRRSAFGTHLVGHIHTAIIFLLVSPFKMLALRAKIMRRQRIYFGYSRHGCSKGRTYRTSRAHKISIGQ